MKVSVIIAVLNSHEVVRRQIEHFKKMELSSDVEIILVDDGSNPPLGFFDYMDRSLLKINLAFCFTLVRGP